MAYSERELLARLIECEAGGEGENGMKAVASVVMNRVRAAGGEYARVGQGSIRNIIFQPGQFVCASETERGAYNPQNIYNMRPTEIHYEIADWAIAGNRLSGLGTAAQIFHQTWACSSCASGITASTIRRRPTTTPETRCAPQRRTENEKGEGEVHDPDGKKHAVPL